MKRSSESNGMPGRLAMCVVLSMFLLLGQMPAFAQKEMETYNMNRGIEAMNNDDYSAALESFEAELDDDPDNGYAYALMSVIYYESGELGPAMSSANYALKYLPRRDRSIRAMAYCYRAFASEALEDYDAALSDYASAIKLSPDDASFYDGRGDLYYKLGEYELSDRDYLKMVELDSGDYMGYMGLARNANARKDFQLAADILSKVVKMEPEYSSGYSFRAESYVGLGKYDEAVDDIISALSIDGDEKAWYILTSDIPADFQQKAVLKLKLQQAKNPGDSSWPLYMALLYKSQGKNGDALDCLLEANDRSELFSYFIADCYKSLGRPETALEYVNYSVAQDSADCDYLTLKAGILHDLDRDEEATDLLASVIEIDPEYYAAYYQRGFYRKYAGDADGAIEDFTMAILIDPSFVYSYLARGDIYASLGDDDLARSDYQEVIQLDTVPEAGSCAFYAYAALGDEDMAIDFLNKILEENPDDAECNYGAACLYSRMKDQGQALSYLRRALELGFRDFCLIAEDSDLDFVREFPEYMQLLDEFRGNIMAAGEPENHEFVDKTAEIPFRRDGETYVVECKVNSLPLRFVLDTGASDVSISDVEAAFMFKNGYLSSRDVRGDGRYLTADGSVIQGTIVNLRDIEFAGLHLRNVRASVVKSQNAPLLLGQSVLSHLGKIEIDTKDSVIRVSYSEKKTDQSE
mgnify:CR=1 FL=1